MSLGGGKLELRAGSGTAGSGTTGGDFTITSGDATGGGLTLDLNNMEVTPDYGVGSDPFWASPITIGAVPVEDQIADLKNRILSLLDGSGTERLRIDKDGFVSVSMKDPSMCIKCSTAKKRLSGCAGAYEHDGLCWSCFGP